MAISKLTHTKLSSRGVKSLTDIELISLLTDDQAMATALYSEFGGSLNDIASCEVSALRMVAGVGLQRAMRILAASEFGRRISISEVVSKKVISTDTDVIEMFKHYMIKLQHEECWVLYLTSSNRIIERKRISQGGHGGASVDSRIIIKRAVELLATHIILVHNHPSSIAEPSAEDKVLTDRIAKAAKLFDINLIDHVIISETGTYSFRKSRLL